jgi:thymidylate synthase
MMIARHTGYKPGVFSHIVANEQIYDRHMDAANEMLKRYYDTWDEKSHYLIDEDNPKLVLNPNVTNFFEMTIDDFTIENYDPIKPQLKLELGI